MGEPREIKSHKSAFTTCAFGVGAIIVLIIASCCYFFFVQGSGKEPEQNTGEVYILKDEVVETS